MDIQSLISSTAVGFFFFVASPVLADEGVPPKAEDIVNSWLGDLYDQANAGDYDVNATLGAGLGYTDNIFVTRHDKEDDFLFLLEPRLTIGQRTEEYQFEFTGTAEVGRYFDFTSEDYEDYFLGLEGRTNIAEGTFIFGGADYAWEHESRTSPDAVAGVEPTLYERGTAYGGIARQVNGYAIRAGVNYIDLDFDNVASSGGSVITNDDRDRTHLEVGVRAGFPMARAYEVFGQINLDQRDYDQAADDFAYMRSSEGWRIGVGARGNWGRGFSGEAFVGLLTQSFDDPRFSDVETLDVGARLTWLASASTELTGYLDRDLNETTTTGASSYLSTTAGIRASHRVHGDLHAGANASYAVNDYQGIDRTDRVMSVGANARYYFMPNIYLGAEYTFSQRNSDAAGADYEQNRIMMRLAAQLRPRTLSDTDPLAPTSRVLNGVYVGGFAGHGMVLSGLDGPRGQGSLTAEFGDDGMNGGAFAGIGTTVGDIYVGVEGDVSESAASWHHHADRDFAVHQGTSVSASVRLGYQLKSDALLYGRFGIVSTEFETPYVHDIYDVRPDEWETGIRFGGGADVPVTDRLFARVEYLISTYGDYDVYGAMQPDNFSNLTNMARFGLGYRLGGGGREEAHAAQGPTNFSGFYGGIQAGHGAVSSDNIGYRSGGGFTLNASRAGQGFTGGVFAGYGRTFNNVYIGAEAEAELGNTNWAQERNPEGRIYSVEKAHTVGLTARLGVILDDHALLYGRAGVVQTRFENDYEVGAHHVTPAVDLTGTRFGGGVEVEMNEQLFLRLDYTYTTYEDYNVDYVSDVDRFENHENLFRIGVVYRPN